MGGRASRFCAAIASSVVVLASAGCVRLDEGHCIVNGGDFACEEGRLCATELTEIAEDSDEGDGCLWIEGMDYDFEEYFVHVKYGLPEALWSRVEQGEDLDSVEGVIVRAVEERGGVDTCGIDEAVMELETRWREVKAVRTFLERPSRVRVEAARLKGFQVEAIDRFNEGIDAWVDGCKRG